MRSAKFMLKKKVLSHTNSISPTKETNVQMILFLEDIQQLGVWKKQEKMDG